MDEFWRWLHLVAAAFWLGGLILMAMVAVVARGVLQQPLFGDFMRLAGRAFLAGSIVAWALIAVSGAGLAAARLHALSQLQSTAWGRTLELKTVLAVAVVALAGVHSAAGRRSSARAWILLSRTLSPVIALLTLAIFYLAVRLTEG